MVCGARGEGFLGAVKDIFGGLGKIRGGALLGLVEAYLYHRVTNGYEIRKDWA